MHATCFALLILFDLWRQYVMLIRNYETRQAYFFNIPFTSCLLHLTAFPKGKKASIHHIQWEKLQFCIRVFYSWRFSYETPMQERVNWMVVSIPGTQPALNISVGVILISSCRFLILELLHLQQDLSVNSNAITRSLKDFTLNHRAFKTFARLTTPQMRFSETWHVMKFPFTRLLSSKIIYKPYLIFLPFSIYHLIRCDTLIFCADLPRTLLCSVVETLCLRGVCRHWCRRSKLYTLLKYGRTFVTL
jgi:hypothetical protein